MKAAGNGYYLYYESLTGTRIFICDDPSPRSDKLTTDAMSVIHFTGYDGSIFYILTPYERS